jgi:hypothetical protein
VMGPPGVRLAPPLSGSGPANAPLSGTAARKVHLLVQEGIVKRGISGLERSGYRSRSDDGTQCDGRSHDADDDVVEVTLPASRIGAQVISYPIGKPAVETILGMLGCLLRGAPCGVKYCGL